MRLENVTIDARDPARLAAWWCEALGWKAHYEGDGEVCVNSPGPGPYDPATWPFPDLVFVQVDRPEPGRERVHLDLASTSLDEQQATVERLLAMGATRADVGQAPDAPFVVLADPEGNPFCVLDPRDEYAGMGPIAAIVVAAVDAPALRDLYAAATGWDVAWENPGFITLRDPQRAGPPLELITRPGLDPADGRKNRIHLDVAPPKDADQAAIVDELIRLGARHADVGQGPDVTWVVLQDPEGNELCVLSPRE